MAIVLVTGAAGALGADVARHLVKNAGHKLALVDIPQADAALRKLAAELEGNAIAISGDTTDTRTWDEALPRIERELGALPSGAALIAGGWQGGTPLHAEKDDKVWRTMITQNLETAHTALRALLPSMVAQKQGSIVVVGSRAVERPWTSTNAAAYAAAKTAVVTLAQVAAAEVVASGVRINAILPSTLDTAANRRAMPSVDPATWVTTSSAAGVIAFLLDDASRDISGAAIPLYGRA
jgi:NAD(P)-dependent dehydrogenase (short-subunit alcohol dehydrogenase family)